MKNGKRFSSQKDWRIVINMSYGKPEKICKNSNTTTSKAYKQALKRSANKQIRNQKINKDSPSNIKVAYHGWSD